jgi:lysophospholipase L1-like esterase
MAKKNLGRVQGLSAYEVWLEQGNTGTEQDFINSLKGETGEISVEEITKITGNLENLSTEDKNNLVNAINEVMNSIEECKVYTLKSEEISLVGGFYLEQENKDKLSEIINKNLDENVIVNLVRNNGCIIQLNFKVDTPTQDNSNLYVNTYPIVFEPHLGYGYYVQPINYKAKNGVITVTDFTRGASNTIKYFAKISDITERIPTNISAFNNDKGYLTSIPLEYVTENELSEKGYVTESFVTNKIAEAELSGSDVDLSGLATKDELNNKVDKVKGKSLIDDTEIERLKTVSNYDDTEIKNTLKEKADKTELHSHTNKTVLDNITAENINEWNDKSEFDGNYNSLTNKPNIPTKVSELTNDKNYLTAIPSEYITETELNNKKYLTSIPSDYKTKTENDSLYQPKGSYLTSYTETDPTVPSHVKNIKETDISKWNNKSEFSGNYNDLTNKPTIPTVPTNVSAFTNDKGYLTSVPSEYVTETELSGKNYATKSELHSHSNKSVLDNTTASYTTAEKTKLAGLSELTADSIADVLGYMPANTKEIEDLMTYKEDYIITPNINGYVQVSDLYFKTNSEAKRTDYISVYGYHRIEFTTKISKSGYAVLFFDENRVAMPSVSVVGTNSKQVIDMAIPEGAMFVICCQYQYSSATGRLYRTSNNDTANALGQLKKSAYTFKGKKAMFFGDSITYDGNMYRNNLLERTEMEGIYCFAQNGARLANYSDTVMDGVQVSGDSHNNTVPNQVQHLLNNLTTYTDVPDIIIVSAATNGGDSEEGLDETQYTDSDGLYIDVDTVNLKTFSGAMRWIYEKLKGLYPDVTICFATPIQSANAGSRTFAKLSKKAECIRQNCERLCTPCIDAFRKSGINARYEVASASGKYLKDGLHPNTAGAVVLAKCYHKELANTLID